MVLLLKHEQFFQISLDFGKRSVKFRGSLNIKTQNAKNLRFFFSALLIPPAEVGNNDHILTQVLYSIDPAKNMSTPLS